MCSSNIPAGAAYGVYISLLVVQGLVFSTVIVRTKLSCERKNNPNKTTLIKSLLEKFYGCHHEPVDRHEILISQIAMDLFSLVNIYFSSITDKTFTGPDYMCNMVGVL